MKETLLTLLAFEPDFETQLDILTAIGTATNNALLFRATEEVRNELVSKFESKEVRPNILRSHESDDHISNFLL